MVIYRALQRTLLSIITSGLWWQFIKCLIFTGVTLAIFMGIVQTALSYTQFFTTGWIEWVVDNTLIAGASFIAWFLFPILTPLIAAFMYDSIADKIEHKEYKHVVKAQKPKFLPILWHDMRFALWALFLNILLFPLYFIPFLNIVLYYGLNATLLGKEFFSMIGSRFHSIAELKAIRKQHKMIITSAGGVITLLVNIPIVNFAAPFLAVALMVHVFHQLNPQPRNPDYV